MIEVKLPSPTITEEQALTALCLWEAMIERRENNPQMDKYWSAVGSVEMRRVALLVLTPIAERVWLAIPEDKRPEPFDWEFIPAFVDHLWWDDGNAPYVKDEPSLGWRLVDYWKQQNG